MKTLSDKITLNLNDDEIVSVKGIFGPIDRAKHKKLVEWGALANLRVAEPEKEYLASDFRGFLPQTAISVGECWEIEKRGALALLKQLHPNADLDVRINIGDSCGLWACLRAYNDKFANIALRIHAYFPFEDGRFTPSQFAGHLVIDRIKVKITFFQMHVPDGTWFDVARKKYKDDSGFYTDGGVCPQIELLSGAQIPDTEYTESITQEEAEYKLIRCFYKSQRINWMPFEDALEMAQAQQKPIHAVSIDGPLDDEAC